jgi:hypothetical protein
MYDVRHIAQCAFHALYASYASDGYCIHIQVARIPCWRNPGYNQALYCKRNVCEVHHA